MAEAHADLRFVRVAPRKARAGDRHDSRSASSDGAGDVQAYAQHAARVVGKALRSAVANAEQKEMGDSEAMVHLEGVRRLWADYKRFRARSMGRANAIQKRTSHITVVVAAPIMQARRDNDHSAIVREAHVVWVRKHIQ